MQPTVCVCYIEAKEPEALERSLLTMTQYPWVTAVVVLHTDQDRPTHWNQRVQHVYKNLGYGFDRQPENGGLDEVDARNRMLRLAREVGCDWLLMIDADEFFMPTTIATIVRAHREQMDAIVFEHFHFLTPTEYFFDPRTVHQIVTGGPRMHDPHIRAMRSAANVKIALNPNKEFRESIPNRTIHYSVDVRNTDRVMCAPGLFHIHTHHMYEPKRQIALATWDRDKVPLRTLRSENIFPRAYLDAYQPIEEPAHSS